MTDIKKYKVSEDDLAKSLARMLSAPRSVRVGLTGGQKRALSAAKAAGKTTTTAA
jgi:hypothetical protein